MFLSCWDVGGGILAATMVIGGVLSTGAFAAQHCCLCGHDVQWETDPSMYPYVIVWPINFPFFVSSFRLYVFVRKLV